MAAGVVKAKKYDWKDSNIAMIGSDSDRKVKKESAQTEPAWKGAGEKVTHWPKDDYGKFFNGDSYIILNTYKKPDTEQLNGKVLSTSHWAQLGYYYRPFCRNLSPPALSKASIKTQLWSRVAEGQAGSDLSGPALFLIRVCGNSEFVRFPPGLHCGDGLLYDVHFWIGQFSSQDEYATAAYKTVELDTLLDDKPIQHREVMGYESDLFRTYFKSISILEGGADSGFKHVKPTEYKPRLLHFHGDNHGVKVVEKPLNKHYLDSSDVFILDMGLKLYQWNGKTGNKDEKYKAAIYIQEIRRERDGKPSVEVLDEESTEKSHIFYKSLSDDPLETEGSIHVAHDSRKFEPCMFRLSDATGKLTLTKLDNPISKSKLDEKDVFIVDIGKQVFVWIGKETSAAENKNAMSYAHNYLKDTDHPLVPVTCIKSGVKSDDAFNKAFILRP
eukprot:Em0007g928a